MTISEIRDAMNEAESSWWRPNTMAVSGMEVDDEVYEGKGGIFFVASERSPHGYRSYSVRQFDPGTNDISTVGDFCSMSYLAAHVKADSLAE